MWTQKSDLFKPDLSHFQMWSLIGYASDIVMLSYRNGTFSKAQKQITVIIILECWQCTKAAINDSYNSDNNCGRIGKLAVYLIFGELIQAKLEGIYQNPVVCIRAWGIDAFKLKTDMSQLWLQM